MDLISARNARAEALAVAPAGFDVRTLEPSPPAVDDDDFFADDPAALGDGDPAATVTPTTAGSTTWDELASATETIAEFAADRWLGSWRRLDAPPEDYGTARRDYHRLAYSVVATARFVANGKFGLRYTAGGFGTPFFGTDRQVRLVGHVLVDQRGAEVRTHAPTSIRDAADFVGVSPGTEPAEHDSPPLGDIDGHLDLRPDVGDFLGAWFGFAASVLEEIRSRVTDTDEPGRVQLWPGHFDPAVELGAESTGSRATFGASPGDGSSDQPYLYIGPWGPIDDGDPFWNASAFPGALLPLSELMTETDQRQRAIDFFEAGRRRLRPS